jgi:hypothetical protein
MKIYIDQEKPSLPSSFLGLAKDNKNNAKIVKVLKKLDKYLIKKQTINDIYSNEGIYQIHENQTYKLHIKSEKVHENIVLNKSYDDDDDKQITLVIDDSVIEKEFVHQIPYDHINIPLTSNIYSLNKNNNYNKSGLTLVIEFIQNDKENIKPINYYFECASEIGYNNLPIEDINVFLSLLN